MMTAILAGELVLAFAASVHETGDGYFAHDTLYPFTAGVTGLADVEPPEGARPEDYRFAEGTLIAMPDEPPPVPPAPVPELVSMRQARLALLHADLLDAADATIAGMAGTQGRAAQIEWGYATEVRRDHPMIAAMADTLGLTAGQVDDLFRAAAAVP